MFIKRISQSLIAEITITGALIKLQKAHKGG